MEIINDTVFLYYFTSNIDFLLLMVLLSFSFIFFYFIAVKYCKVLYLQPLHVYFFYVLTNILTMFLFKDSDYKLESIVLFIELIFFSLIAKKLKLFNVKIPQIKLTQQDCKTLSSFFFILYLCLNIYVYIKYYLSGNITTDDFKVGWTEQEPIISFIYGGTQSIFLATCVFEIINTNKSQFLQYKNVYLILKLTIYSFFSIFVFKIKGFFLTVIYILSLYFVSQNSQHTQTKINRVHIGGKSLHKLINRLLKSILIIFVMLMTLNYIFGLSFEGFVLFTSRILQSSEALFWAMYHNLSVEKLGYNNSFYIDSTKFFTYTVGKVLGITPEAQGNILAHAVPQLPKSEFGGPNTSLFFHYVIGAISFIEVSILLFIFTFVAIKINLFLNQRKYQIELYELILAFPLYNLSPALSADIGTVLLLLAKEYIVIILFLSVFRLLRVVI
ncbi:hypothetical protein NIES2101_16000 [Calothrix sp. HK-06]|nr:hypothetical protein NIES2101_16000 [Calothrix sp. HK-06]